MRILIFTLIPIKSVNEKGLYIDLVNEFISKGHTVDYCFGGKKTSTIIRSNSLNVYELNTVFTSQKNRNFFLKFISYIIFSFKAKKFIMKSKNDYEFMILVTPSIFQSSLILAFKNKYHKKVILLLKDIFPDNAIDLNLFSNLPFKKVLIYYFHLIEKNLYKKVDFIGCMNHSNLIFILNKYPNLKNKLFISHNSIKSYPLQIEKVNTTFPKDSTKFIFIGNIGLPQNISAFEVLLKKTNNNVFFLIIGSGTEFNFLKKLEFNYPHKISVIQNISNYRLIDTYLSKMDAGLILLNPNFRVPNYPSKLLTYLNAKLPIIAFTDKNNEIANVINSFNLGYWSDYNDIENCVSILNNFKHKRLSPDFDSLLNIYSVENQVDEILKIITR